MSLEEIFQNQKPVEDAANEHTVIGKDGMVSCPVKEAAEVGEEVLKEGGNAMDAVIAMQLAPRSCRRDEYRCWRWWSHFIL